MADFLLELFSEEIPARMQEAALEYLQAGLHKALGVTASEGFVTPRRLAVIIKNLPPAQPDVTIELKGPKVSAPEAALNGFLKKNNLAPEALEKRDGVYFAAIHQKGRATAEILKPVIGEMLEKFPWPKSMRWGNGQATWVRPLHSILCIFDGAVVPVEFAGVKAGNVTYGHRFLAPSAITVNNPEEYEISLEKAFVIADRSKRKDLILKQAEAVAASKKLIVKKDGDLLEEVVGLVEYPVVLLGRIDDGFMDLPPEVLTMVMRSHQKYFALQDTGGGLSPYFLITSNMKAEDGGKAIIAGNERVLRARFADARFFWDADRKKPLSEWAEGLKAITYHAKLGSVADKVERVKALAIAIAPSLALPRERERDLLRAVELCKADLVTGMVGEFAELQGVMGRYYAMQQGEKQEVADAIRDHYKPVGAADSIPTAPVSICASLADKLDTLVSLFAIGERPTGSKDPFALRRAALGVIRIILENNLRLPLKKIFTCPQIRTVALQKAHEKLIRKTEEKLYDPNFTEHKIGKYLTISETAYEDIPEDAAEKLNASLLDFITDRLKVQLKGSGIRHDVIDAVMAGGDDDLVRVVARARAVQEFLLTENGSNLLAGYKRAANIVNIEEKKDKTSYKLAKLDVSILKEPEEITLASLLETTSKEFISLKSEEKYTEAMGKLAALRGALDQFFEKIMVNDKNKDLRIMRLCLLACARDTMDGIADFAKIEG